MFFSRRKYQSSSDGEPQAQDAVQDVAKTDAQRPQDVITEDESSKGKLDFKTLLPVIACGAGLFSDGYINNVCPKCSISRSYMSLCD
jgi:hypothetical protein